MIGMGDFTKQELAQDMTSLLAQILTDIPIHTRHGEKLAAIIFEHEELIWAHMEQVQLENKAR